MVGRTLWRMGTWTGALLAAFLLALGVASTASAAPGPRVSVTSGVGGGKLSIAVQATRAAGWKATLESRERGRWTTIATRTVPRSGKFTFTRKAPSATASYRVSLQRKGHRPVVSRVLTVSASTPSFGGLPTAPVAGASGPPAGGPGGGVAPSPGPAPGGGPSTTPTTTTPTPTTTTPTPTTTTPTTTPPSVQTPPPTVVVPTTAVVSAPVPPDDGTAPVPTGQLVLDGIRGDVKPGDTVAVGIGPATPYGFLGKVTQTSPSNGNTVVKTTSTTLVDALDSGAIDASFDAELPDSPRRRTAALSGAVTQPVSRKVNCESSGSIKLEGSLSITPHFAFSAKWSLLHLVDSAKFTGSVTASASLTGIASAASKCTLKPTPLLAKPITFSPVQVQVGPIPVVLVPRLQIYLLANGEVSANLTTGITASATGTVGAQYQRGDGFSPIAGLTAGFDYDPPTLDSDAHLDAGIRPQLDLLLYGVAGPYVNLTGSLAFDASSTDDPWWTLKGILKAGAGLTVPVLGLDWGKDDIFTKAVTLAQATDAPPVPMISIDGPKLDLEPDDAGNVVARVMLQAGHPFSVYNDSSGNADVRRPSGEAVPSTTRGNVTTVEPSESGLAFIRLYGSGPHPSLWTTSVVDHGVVTLPLDQQSLSFDRPGRVERFKVALVKGDELDYGLDTGGACLYADVPDYGTIVSSCAHVGVAVTGRTGTATVDVFLASGAIDFDSTLSLSRPATVTMPVGGDSMRVQTSVPGQRAIVQATGAAGAVGVAALDSGQESVYFPDASPIWTYEGSGDRYTRFLAAGPTTRIEIQAADAAPVDLTLWLSPDVVHEVTLPADRVPVTHSRPGQAQVLRFAEAKDVTVTAAVTDVDGSSGAPTYVPGVEDLGATVSCVCGWSGDWTSRLSLSHSGTWQVVMQLADRSPGSAKMSVSRDVELPLTIDAAAATVATSVPGQQAHVTFDAGALGIFSYDLVGAGAGLSLDAQPIAGSMGESYRRVTDAAVNGWLAGGTTPFSVKLRLLSPHVTDVAAPGTGGGTTRTATVDVPRRMVGFRFTPVDGETYDAIDVDGDGPSGRPDGGIVFVDNGGTLLSAGSYTATDTRQVTLLFLPSNRKTGTVDLRLSRR